MNNRREVIKGGLGLAAIIAAGRAPAAVVKSMLGANGADFIISNDSDFPYVTKGLIAMWDGEWNAGYGIHDPNATVWKDLSGKAFDFEYVSGNSTIEDKSLFGIARSTGNFLILQNNYTIEIVSKFSYAGGSVAIASNVCWFDPICKNCQIQYWQEGRPLICGHFQNSYITRSAGHWQDISSISLISNGTRTSTPGASVRWSSWVRSCWYNGELSSLDNHGSWTNNPSSENLYSTIGGYDAYWNNGVHTFCIRVYNRALSDNERSHNYQIDQERFGI